MLTKFEVLRAIDLFVMGDLLIKANPNHYVKEVRELSKIWEMEVMKLNRLVKRIEAGEKPSSVLENHYIAGTPGKLLTLIKNGVDGTLKSNDWKIVNGRFQRLSHTDPYAY